MAEEMPMSVLHNDQGTSITGLHMLLRGIDTGLTLVGVLVVMGAILFVHDLRGQIVIAAGGILMIEAGVWCLMHRLLSNQRKSYALRAEVNRFLVMVRQLDTAALTMKAHDVPETRQAFTQISEAMKQSVECMTAVAGTTDAELVTVARGVVSAEHNTPLRQRQQRLEGGSLSDDGKRRHRHRAISC